MDNGCAMKILGLGVAGMMLLNASTWMTGDPVSK
jgi:hypothetical protein